MNQIPNVDRVEEIVEEFDKLYVVHCSDGDILDGMVDAKKVKNWIRTTLHQQLQKAIQERDEWWNKHEQEMYEALEEEYNGLVQKSEEDIRLLTEEIGHLREDVQKARQSLLTDLQAYADKYELEDVRQVVEVFSDNK